MQSVPREWLDFLRQQFPKDSRIQLTEIGGNPRPISPGSTGKLDYIDDAGQFHVKWDNGCTLALVLGEDRFSVYLPEPQTFKLYMPLTADFYGRDEWGDMSEDGEEWDGHTLMDYEGQILSALVKNRVPEENESGLMRWYGEDDSVDHKVRSAVFTVEVRNRQLWGVAECRVAGELTPEELTILKEYLGGQASDGWGEGFEQQAIQISNGVLNVHFWNAEHFAFEVVSVQSEESVKRPPVPKRPTMKLIGEDGNIFAILGRASRLLRENGQQEQAKEMTNRVFRSVDYYSALNIISEYVQTELSEKTPTKPKTRSDMER